MLSKLLGTLAVQRLLLIGYSALAIGLPLNKIVLSLATILLALITLLDFNKKDYCRKIQGNKLIQVLLLFLFIHLLSYFWSDNSSYFWKDVNAKLPFYTLPLVFVLKPIRNTKELHIILGSFLLSLLVTSCINFIVFYNCHPTADTREMSLFLSHIRYGLMLVFGVVICFFWLKAKAFKFKMAAIVLMFWFFIYIYFSEIFSSYLILFVVILILGINLAVSSKKIVIKGITYSFLAGLTGSLLYTFTYYFFIDIKPIPIPKKDERTAKGNRYDYSSEKSTTINGTPVYTYICGLELKEEWAKRSTKNLFEKNQRGYENYYILIQYLASKGFLKKDARSMAKLSDKDIQNIEKGINNCCPEKNSGFIKRIKNLREELFESDPNGKTVRQRIEYLTAGSSLFLSNPIIGVGSGDLEDAFLNYYHQNNSKLLIENRLRTHNQFLTYFISFGLIGGSIFLFFIIKSLCFFTKEKITVGFIFLVIMFFSFLSEDTLETQMGATFFGLFYGLFISVSGITDKNEHF